MKMTGIIAHCIYDELGTITEVSHGREESEDGGSEQGVDSKADKGSGKGSVQRGRGRKV
jgi:hypothetical protein